MPKTHSRVLVQLIRDKIITPKYGAEIGVFRGENAQHLLSKFPGLVLSMVDPWMAHEESSRYYKCHSNMGKLTLDQWEKVYDEAVRRTSKWAMRRHVMRVQSVHAAALHQNRSLDFAFLDASHLYEDLKTDVEAWLPKVRRGGLICGHDYGGRCGDVKRLVDETFGGQNVIVGHGMVWGVVIHA